MASISYRPEIDGLRAFAVVPVILFHMDFKWIAGGYIGVDVFFVISGFLITSILKHDLEAGSFSFRTFWARRVRRILPAMIVVTAASLSFAYLFCFKPDHSGMGWQAVAALLSLANVYFWRTTGDYWGTQAEESPFLHTWSLSVEEQFYIFFPVVLFLTYRFSPRRLPGLMLFAIVSSLTVFLYGCTAHPTSTFYLLPTRAWELATGCYLAVVLQGRRAEESNAEPLASLALFGLCLVMASYVLVPTLNGGLVVAVLGTALVLAFSQSGACNTILTRVCVVHVGKLSYSLYLWHWPILVFAHRLGFESHKAALLIPIYVLSLASYHLVERPTRHRAGAVRPIVVCYLLTLGFSALLILSPPLYDTSDFERPHWYGLYYDLKPRNELSEVFKQIAATMDVPKREASPEAYRNGGIIVGGGDGTPRVVVLGDSHGVMWSDAIRVATERIGVKASFISMNGITPFITLPLRRDQMVRYLTSEEKYTYDKSRLDLIESWKPDIVILCCRWSIQDEAGTRDLLEALQGHTGKILLMEQPPELALIGNRNALQYAVFRGIKPELGVRKYFPIGNASKWESGRELIRTLAAKHDNCGYIPTCDLFIYDTQAVILDGRNMVYVDDDHLTTYGARLASPRIEQVLSDTFKGIRKR